jgi:tight adherence protein B
MIIAFLGFLVVAGSILGGYAAVTYLPDMISNRRFERRMRDVAAAPEPTVADGAGPVVKREKRGPLPIVDRVLNQTQMGDRLKKLIQQSGSTVTPSSVIVYALISAIVAYLVIGAFVHFAILQFLLLPAGFSVPFLVLTRKRTLRLRKFEEMFPEALDLLSRAIRAGHAFQTAMGMARTNCGSRSDPSSRQRSISRTTACRCATRSTRWPSAYRSSTCGSS